MGDTGDGSYATLYGYAWAGLLDRVERRFCLFQAQVPGEGPWPLHDPRGPEVAVWVEVEVPPLPHPVEEIRHLALAFDQAARHVVAYEREGEVWVRQWDPFTQSFVQRGPFPGADPVLINDATVGRYVPDSDVLLFHLTPDRLNLVMRVQREGYATARSVWVFERPVVLDQVVELPYRIELLGSFTNALEATGFVVHSGLYPYRPEAVIALEGRFASGEYELRAFFYKQEARLVLRGAFTSGEYVQPVIIYPPHEAKLALQGAFTTGEYRAIVQTYSQSQKLALQGQFSGGTYLLIAFPYQHAPAKLALQGQFIGGTYAAS
ncbi:hypothetical protein AV953_gp23 [Thermus virus IN93]|uniref:Uncharacterized protein n=1 Tax=Thermus virus IN93 TaxID=1714273 RepID=Q859R9_9VIRU|nr:hypothetical protein AV953_gp23 [Thermus virus IN93]BAC55302.1 hypothetical protein [Thermus virus IN93]